MKILILDSGILINLSMNGLLYVLEELKKISNIKILITKDVRYETIDRPIGIPKFELGALRIQNLINLKIIELPDSLQISEKELNSLTQNYLELANHSIQSHNQFIQIVSNAEMSCLALSKILSDKNIENIIAIDERTTRIISERPENLEKLMSDKLHQKITINAKNLAAFSQFKFIRSSELIFSAFKKGAIKLKGPKVLEAALYAVKYHGSSISFEEIDVLKKL